MSADNRSEDARVTAFLAPLADVSPATLRGRSRISLRRLAPLVVGLMGIAAAGAIAATQSGPLHDVTAQPDAGPLTCSGIIGESSQDAQSYLEGHGYAISWRYQTFSSVTEQQPSGSEPGAVGGYSREVSTPPADSIVSDVLPTDTAQSVVVLTQGRDDPDAPQVLPPDCANDG